MSREPAAAHDARTGARDAVDLPPGFEFFALPPAEAIRYFQALGIEPTWDYREMWTAEQRRAFTVAKLTQLDLLEFAYREVDRGIAEGMSLSEFQQRMTERLDEAGWGGVLGSSRLENIYRTNLASAYSAGEWERIEASAAERAANGEVTYLEFNAVGDSRTREDHEARSGTVLPATDPWWSDNTPPLDFQLIPEGTIVRSPEILAAFRRRYEGDLLTLRMGDGSHLAISPHHPVLTPRGWVAARLLREGDYVMNAPIPSRLAGKWGSGPHHQNVPALAEEIFNALLLTPGFHFHVMKATAEDFHGDGTDGKVDVVWTDRLFPRELQADMRQRFRKYRLKGTADHISGRALTFPRRGPVRSVIERLRAATDALVHTRQNSALGVRHGLALNPYRFAHAAYGQPQPWKADLEHIAIARILSRQATDRLAGQIFPVKGIHLLVGKSAFVRHWHSLWPSAAHAWPRWLTKQFQPATDGTDSDAERSRNLLDMLAGTIAPTKIVQIDSQRVATLGFDLSTHGGYYAASMGDESSATIVSNCRCWLTEHTESTLARYGLKPTERPDTPPVEVENPHTGERFTVPQGVAPGFGRHNWDTAVREIYDQRMAAALPAVRRAVGWGVTEVQLQPRPLARLAERLQSGSVEDLRAENLHPEKIGASEQPDAKFYADIPEGAARALAREAKLLGVREYEHVTGFDRWGITVLPRTTSDERDGVTLPKVEWMRAQDGYVIHTHPVGLPFSRRDLEQAIRRNFAGIAVVGPASDGSIIEFLVLRPKHGWGSIARLKSLYAEEQAHVAAFLPEIETLTREEIRWLVRDGVWSALDRRGIVRYRRRRK